MSNFADLLRNIQPVGPCVGKERQTGLLCFLLHIYMAINHARSLCSFFYFQRSGSLRAADLRRCSTCRLDFSITANVTQC